MPKIDWTWLLIGAAVGYFLLGQLLGLLFGAFSSLTGENKKSGGASPTGYAVNAGR
jgi:hypothetical protein